MGEIIKFLKKKKLVPIPDFEIDYNEPELRIVTEHGERLIRKGFCNGCGWCCKVIARVGIDPTQEEDKHYAEVRGITGDKPKWFNAIDPCSKLDCNDKCTIYQARPKTCQEFPQDPYQIVDSPCTYYFEDEEGNRV